LTDLRSQATDFYVGDANTLYGKSNALWDNRSAPIYSLDSPGGANGTLTLVAGPGDSSFSGNLTWTNDGGTSAWNEADHNWTGTTTNGYRVSQFRNGDSVFFQSGQAGAVVVDASGVSVQSMNVDGGYAFTGGRIAASGFAFTGTAAASVGNVLTGAGGLSKSGAGTLTLTGTNDYSGTTTVSEGTLVGNIAAGGDLTVASGATYDGNGAPVAWELWPGREASKTPPG
jgi:autotransporter-associated beta strand protein